MTGLLPREITPLVREALASLPVVVVTGLRQAGKTTLLATDPAFAGRRRSAMASSPSPWACCCPDRQAP